MGIFGKLFGKSRSREGGGLAVVVGSGFCPSQEMVQRFSSDGHFEGCSSVSTVEDPNGWTSHEAYTDKAILAKKISGEVATHESFRLSGPQGDDIAGISQIRYLEYVFSISYAILNDTTGGWLVNLHLIMFMEQVEVLMLLWFFRRYFRPEIPN